MPWMVLEKLPPLVLVLAACTAASPALETISIRVAGFVEAEGIT